MLKQPLTEQEIERVINACNTDFERHLVLFLLNTGMHITVLVNQKDHGLKITKGDNGSLYLIWQRPKTKKFMRLKVSKNIKDFVESFLKEAEKHNYTRQYYFYILKEIGSRAGIKELSPMTFRHTFGVKVLKAGADISILKDLMGVRNTSVLMRYIQYTDKHVDEFYDKTEW